MAHLADLELNKELERPVEQPRRLGRRVLLGTALAVTLGALAYYVIPIVRDGRRTGVRVQTEQAVVPQSAEPRAETGEQIALPPLDETDAIVRELVARLSAHPKLAAWLATDQLIRNFTVSVVNVAGGQSPARHLQAVQPTGTFTVASVGSLNYIDPRSYRRYDDYGDAMAALDARGSAQLYATLKPRIDDAARELGEPNADFDRTLERAIVELLRTPVVDGRIAIVSDPVFWVYADPRLQSLSSAQRQLLRMGPRNVQLVQNKLREIAPYLGIAESKIPPASVLKAQ